jgi:hypothetical protein
MHTQAFAASMRLRLHPFVSDVLAQIGIAASQLALNGWHTLARFSLPDIARGTRYSLD